MRKFLIVLALAFLCPAYATQVSKSFLIQFSSGDYTLDPEALSKLKEVKAYLKLHPRAKIKLIGHTDFDGTLNYNKNLSKQRTETVAQHLINSGWSQTEISENWIGELRPLASNFNEEGKAVNRSVEILITFLHFKNTEEWLKEKQENKTKTYWLNANKTNSITTDNATVINIPQNAFKSADGSEVDLSNIKIKLKEVNTLMDAMINNVYTMSGDQLLETGGMISIEAISNNTELVLADGKQINIQLPTQTSQTDMFVFEGVKDASGKIDWQNTSKPFATNAMYNRVSNKLNETVLKKLIDGIGTEVLTYKDFQLSMNAPKPLNAPSKPKPPREPEKPEAKSLFSQLGWILSTPKMRKKRVEQVHRKNMASYQERLKFYNEKLLAYSEFMKVHQTKVENFNLEVEQVYAWLRDTKKALNQAIDQIYDHHDKVRVKRGMQYLYSASVSGTQYHSMPMTYLQTFSRTTRLTETETVRIEHLTRMKRFVNRLLLMKYENIYKKWVRNGKINILKVPKVEIKDELNYSERLWNNKFLENYIIENQSDFSSVFGEEMNGQVAAIQQQRLANQRVSAQQYFTGNTPKLGWINCDRFVKADLTPVTFKRYPESYQVVVLTNIKSMLSPNYNSSSPETGFVNLPKNEKFKFVTLRVIDDYAMVSVMESTATTGLKIEPQFRKIPVEDLDGLLADL